MTAVPSHPPTHLAFRITLIVLTTVFSVLTWLILGSVFGLQAEERPAGLGALIGLATVSFVFLLALFAVTVIINRHRSDLITLVVLLSFSVFLAGITLFTALAAILVAVGFIWWRDGMLTELRERLTFSFRRSLQRSFGLGLTFFFLAITATSVAGVQPLQGTRQLSDALVKSGGEIIQTIAPRFLPGFTPERTLNAYLTDQVRQQEIPPELIDQTVAETREQVKQNLSIDVTGDETLAQISEQAIRDRVEPAIEKYSHVLVPIIVVTLFLTLKLLQPLIWWSVLGLGAIIFRLFWQLRVVKVVKAQQEVEHLVNL